MTSKNVTFSFSNWFKEFHLFNFFFNFTFKKDLVDFDIEQTRLKLLLFTR